MKKCAKCGKEIRDDEGIFIDQKEPDKSYHFFGCAPKV